MTVHIQNCAASITATPADSVGRLAHCVRCWIRIRRLQRNLRQERRQLLTLSESMLGDIGITRAEAGAEAARRDIPDPRLALEPARI